MLMITAKIFIETSKLFFSNSGRKETFKFTKPQLGTSKLTRAGIAGHGAGDDEDASADGGANANEDEVNETEAADERIPGNPANGGIGGRRIGQGFGPEGRRPESGGKRRRGRRRRRGRVESSVAFSHHAARLGRFRDSPFIGR